MLWRALCIPFTQAYTPKQPLSRERGPHSWPRVCVQLTVVFQGWSLHCNSAVPEPVGTDVALLQSWGFTSFHCSFLCRPVPSWRAGCSLCLAFIPPPDSCNRSLDREKGKSFFWFFETTCLFSYSTLLCWSLSCSAWRKGLLMVDFVLVVIRVL